VRLETRLHTIRRYIGQFLGGPFTLLIDRLGQRPFGVSLLYAGWDQHYGFQLYMSDPSGNYGGWKACSIGAGNETASSLLKSDYREDMTLQEAQQFVVKVLSKTMDSTSMTSEKCARFGI